MKGYRICFAWRGAAVFALVMLPNILWEIFLSDDILHRPSLTPGLDAAMAVSQWLFVAALCLVEVDRGRTITEAIGWGAASGTAVVLYWCCWALYFSGMIGWPVLLGLTVFPCGAFLLFTAGHRNWIAFVPAAVFSILHLCHFWGNYM